LLSTSGSTGSAKQVRLSYQNIQSNADAISDYLELNETERAITTLPMHYSYGLSVINSHLSVGASIVLTNASLMNRAFWDLFKEHKVTSLAGVPYTYALLEKLRFNQMDLSSLRYMTQAGGKMGQKRVQHFADILAEQGKRFFIMYGQTEATARISYLPPKDLETFPESIGIAIPEGQLSLENEKGLVITEPDVVGELVYQGENVMMGYALSQADLSKGSELKQLHTGDLAYQDERGYFYIVGRQSRFIKLFGVRIDLDDLELRLKEKGWQAFCIGNDNKLGVACLDDKQIKAVTHYLTEAVNLHQSAFVVCYVPTTPLTENGKVSYVALEKIMNKMMTVPE